MLQEILSLLGDSDTKSVLQVCLAEIECCDAEEVAASQELVEAQDRYDAAMRTIHEAWLKDTVAASKKLKTAIERKGILMDQLKGKNHINTRV